MHELSLVKSLLSQVRSIVVDNKSESAEEVVVEIGPLSGVEVELVRSAFNQLSSELNQSGTTLTIHEVPLVVRCLDCGCESEVRGFVFRCQHCSSGRVQVIRGDEFRLVSVTLTESPVNA
ncbi:hydrogenase maturation nickel metallochaperone HypA/HybF [Rubripirellula reticaptiva]|uniref:Hydrogenase maturation factor HypA n=1 Tax=Rubripirellula reticaptiva TaxID=2528013 RepID=A0A5C6ECH5_9BACT|nr:hydrogenase maturation nickel metallochaperone HypA [Rubripirellula reticaptiva]TWU46702.1 Hydrogenase/urease nickel incorporation protein HypA [Rubripirellula reticaptiva]